MILDYKIVVRHSKRKTASIYIERDSSITVIVPIGTSDAEVQNLLSKYEYKIHKYQAKRALLNENAIKRELVNGQSFLYLGRNYYLQYSDEVESIQFRGRYFYAPEGSEDKLRDMLKEFYRHRGRVFIEPRVQRFAQMMGVNVETISIIDLKNRWASCSDKRPKVNFNWKIMMAPVSVINYLIVHELAHFKYKRHSKDFWNEVDKIVPDYQKQVQWLKEYGAGLDV
jgi:predicted metal-dependent hydrolase